MDGNTAHSTGFWWKHAPGFYFGGALYLKDDGYLSYNPGRVNTGQFLREPCSIYKDCVGNAGTCDCREQDFRPLNFTNGKSFLVAGVGLNSWKGQMNIKGYEAYDQRLAMEALSTGFWVDRMFVACRTGEDLGLPLPAAASRLQGSGWNWYDTGQVSCSVAMCAMGWVLGWITYGTGSFLRCYSCRRGYIHDVTVGFYN